MLCRVLLVVGGARPCGEAQLRCSGQQCAWRCLNQRCCCGTGSRFLYAAISLRMLSRHRTAAPNAAAVCARAGRTGVRAGCGILMYCALNGSNHVLALERIPNANLRWTRVANQSGWWCQACNQQLPHARHARGGGNVDVHASSKRNYPIGTQLQLGLPKIREPQSPQGHGPSADVTLHIAPHMLYEYEYTARFDLSRPPIQVLVLLSPAPSLY